MSEKLAELLKSLTEMSAHLKDAIQAEQAARSECTERRNRVNNLQKEIDAEMEKVRNSAEWDTDWHSKRKRGIAVPCWHRLWRAP